MKKICNLGKKQKNIIVHVRSLSAPLGADFCCAAQKTAVIPRPGMGAAALVLQGREQGRRFSLVTFFVHTKKVTPRAMPVSEKISPQGKAFSLTSINDFALRNLEQWRYNSLKLVETLIGMISRCEILNNGVITR